MEELKAFASERSVATVDTKVEQGVQEEIAANRRIQLPLGLNLENQDAVHKQITRKRFNRKLPSFNSIKSLPRFSVSSRTKKRADSNDSENEQVQPGQKLSRDLNHGSINVGSTSLGAFSKATFARATPSRSRNFHFGEGIFSTDELVIASGTKYHENLQLALDQVKSRPRSAIYAYPRANTNDVTRYALTYLLTLGIGYITRSALETEFQEITLENSFWALPLKPAHFTDKFEMKFPSNGSAEFHTPRHHFGTFKFTEFAPKIFKRLRSIAGVDDIVYRNEILTQQILYEFQTNSKSGNFFFHTVSGNYIVKTQTQAESEMLMRILPGYYRHMLENPDSMLVRFLGLYRLRTPALASQTNYFLIMKSVFSYSTNKNKTVHNVFDLKGATYKRYTEDKTKVKKDINLLEEIIEAKTKRLYFGEQQRAFLNELEKDVFFLRKHDIMDYSLLLAIHDPLLTVHGSLRKENASNNRVTVAFDPVSMSFSQENSGAVELSRSNSSAIRMSMNVFLKTQQSEAESNRELKRGKLSEIVRPTPGSGVEPELIPPTAPQINNLSSELLASNRVVRKTFQEPKFSVFLSQEPVEPNEPPIEYYLGIIDILQPYNMKKRMETWVKGMKTNRHNISSVPASEYARRFTNFVSLLLGSENVEEIKMSEKKIELLISEKSI